MAAARQALRTADTWPRLTSLRPPGHDVRVPDDLAALLPAREGHFLLESGHHGEWWLDLDLLFRHPRHVAALSARLAAALAPHRPDVVCGPLVGGTLVAQLVAGALDVDLCWTEREAAGDAGGPLYAARYAVPAAQRPGLDGATVAVVDDAINAGSAVRATVGAVEACGAEVVALGALLVLGDAAPAWAAGRGLPLEQVTARANAIWSPEECPRCAAGEPLEGVG